MSWRQVAEERLQPHGGEDNRDDRDNSSPPEAIAPIASIVPPADFERLPTEAEARRRCAGWRERIDGLNIASAPAGIDPKRWWQLVEDARWLADRHGEQLAREGWSDLDAFGVLPWREGGGVLLDRLHGSRDLRLDGDGRAFWRWSYCDVIGQSCRGASRWLVGSGLVVVWELPR